MRCDSERRHPHGVTPSLVLVPLIAATGGHGTAVTCSADDQSAPTDFASADFLLAAWFSWMTPFETALSSLRDASTRAVDAASLSPPATASRTRRMCVLSSDFTALLRRRAFSLVVMRLIWDLMLATCGLSCAFAEAI